MSALQNTADPAGVSTISQSERFAKAFAEEEGKGLELAIKGRTAALAVMAVLVAFVNRFPDVLYYHFFIALFAISGLLVFRLHRVGRLKEWMLYVFVVFDFLLLSYILIVQNPFAIYQFPPQYNLRFGNFIFLFVLISGLAIVGRPKLLILGGVSGFGFWLAGSIWLMTLPDTILFPPPGASPDEVVATILDPKFVDPGLRLQELVVFAVVAGLLSLVALRSRQQTQRQVILDRARSNLARYFAPETAERLADRDRASLEISQQDAAVLFSDIVGFTKWAEDKPPSEVIAVLREYHGVCSTAVFAHGGTLDKFIGDGMMVTFGTPVPGERDVTQAVLCLKAILAAVDALNSKRVAEGLAAIEIVVGLHYGAVVFGDIGNDQRLELAAVGDAVNIASRLEHLNRNTGTRAIISSDVAEAVKTETGDHATILEGFEPLDVDTIRGRSGKIRLLGIRASKADPELGSGDNRQ